MVMTGVVVAVACGGAMKGSEKRELWVRFAGEASDLREASGLTIRPGLSPIRWRSLISGLGLVQFAGEA